MNGSFLVEHDLRTMGFAGSRALTIHRGYLECITRIIKQTYNYIMLCILAYFSFNNTYLIVGRSRCGFGIFLMAIVNVTYIALMESALQITLSGMV